jgi:hypothetical protein
MPVGRVRERLEAAFPLQSVCTKAVLIGAMPPTQQQQDVVSTCWEVEVDPGMLLPLECHAAALGGARRGGAAPPTPLVSTSTDLLAGAVRYSRMRSL